MDWVTALWAMLIGGCVAMALPHLLVGIWQRQVAHLCFVAAAASVIAIAVGELFMMRATSVEQFARAQQWTHVPIFVLVVALVAFVRLYFHTGRLWLGLTVCAVRFVSLVINFAFPPSLNFREITALGHLRFLGETVSVPVGVISPWTRLGELSSLLLLVFVIDASTSLWRQGKAESRHRALVAGGSIAFFILMAAGLTALIHRQIVEAPYMVSFPFTAILVAMAFELGSDLFRAGQVVRKLEVSEASLHESEERFRITADAAPVLIWMSGVDKLCAFFNKPWLEFTGRTLQEELGNGWAEGVHPDDLQKCLEVYSEAFDARQPFLMQYRLRRNDGEYRWVSDHGVARYDTQGKFAGYIGSCVDVTELLNKDEALRESEERMRLAADAANLGIWEWDLGNDEVWATNARRALLGWPASGKVTFEDFISRVHPDDRNRIREIIDYAIDEGKDFDSEYRLVLPDGIVRWMATRGSVHFDKDGRPARVLGISIDITARKQAEIEAKQRRDELSHLSRVALIGEMSASIAHELNQPLAGIASNASAGQRFIDRGNIDLQEIRDLLTDISADARRASDVMRQIRGMIRKEQTPRQRINLNDIVMNVVHMVGPDALVHSCELKTSLDERSPTVEADPIQMQQVLVNLIMNAFDAMREIPVSSRKVEITTEQNGDGTVCTSVRDYGAGISGETSERMFEQFFTTKTEGLGMGLAIVRSIVESHGGKIEAENVEGGGARFNFILPTSPEIPK
jgi:two-component system, LuxR family, sensor kinase FixL